MKLKLLVPVILSILIVNPSYSVSEQEFNEMKELLQNALIKINALEQARKQINYPLIHLEVVLK